MTKKELIQDLNNETNRDILIFKIKRYLDEYTYLVETAYKNSKKPSYLMFKNNNNNNNNNYYYHHIYYNLPIYENQNEPLVFVKKDLNFKLLFSENFQLGQFIYPSRKIIKLIK